VLSALLFVTLVLLYAAPMQAAISGEQRVSFSRPSGFYAAPITLSLESFGRSTEIRYTVDGSTPAADSALYAEPLSIAKSTVVKAVVMQEGEPVGKLQTQSYFINEASSLPVVSLVTDPAHLWDPKRGIYVLGTPDENSQEQFIPNDMRRGLEWRRPAYLEFFDEKAICALHLRGISESTATPRDAFPKNP
jgi:hypothetical protein